MFSWLNTIGGIATGIAAALLFSWLVWVPLERREARAGYVLEARAATAEAKLKETERQLNAGQLVISSYEEQARNRLERERLEDAEEQRRNAEYEKGLKDAGKSWLLEQSDIDFILR